MAEPVQSWQGFSGKNKSCKGVLCTLVIGVIVAAYNVV